jgi:hypothetical protein
MIKFIPKLVDIKSPLSDPEGFTSNLANKNIAGQLQNRLSEVVCKEHPESDSIILFEFKESGPLMEVTSYCCDSFKQILDLIAVEKYPLPPKKE